MGIGTGKPCTAPLSIGCCNADNPTAVISLQNYELLRDDRQMTLHPNNAFAFPIHHWALTADVDWLYDNASTRRVFATAESSPLVVLMRFSHLPVYGAGRPCASPTHLWILCCSFFMAHSTSSVIDDNPAYIKNSTILGELSARELTKNLRVAWAVSSRSRDSPEDRTLFHRENLVAEGPRKASTSPWFSNPSRPKTSPIPLG